MNRYVFTALTIALTLTLGLTLTHAQDAMTRGEQGDALTPLAMGNTWVYESDDDDILTTDRIEGYVLFDGQPWYLLRSYEREAGEPVGKDEDLNSDLWLAMIDGHECDAFTLTSEEDEDFGILKLDTASQYYRYPATLGETYKPNADDPTMVMTVTALNEKVKTKAGEFECVVYKETSTEDAGYSFTSYVAPGVGIVKNVTVDEEGDYSNELISYTLVEEE